MNIRIGFSCIFTALVLALIFCAVKSFRSTKKIGKAVGLFDLSLIPAVLGNLIIIGSSIEWISMVGYYVYFIGMDIVMAGLVLFTNEYCQGIGKPNQKHRKPTAMYAILAVDAVQILLNLVLGHCFSLEPVEVQDKIYYKLVAHWGQYIHRVVDYFVLLCVFIMLILACVRTAKVFRERYSVIVISIIIITVWESFYIFSRTPIDRSMIGFGVFGIIVYFLALCYRPLRLLEKMLSSVVANSSDYIYVYDGYGKVIWANNNGIKFLGLENRPIEEIRPALVKKFGERKFTNEDWIMKKSIGIGENIRYYTIENHAINEDKKHLAGSYITIHDNTDEQLRIRREIYNSTHDSLTGLYTKQYMGENIKRVLEENPDTIFVAIFIDVKNFKIVNDVFSPKFGDLALQQIADWIRSDMTEQCVYGRIAGDTFGVFMPKELFEQFLDKLEVDLANFIVTDGKVEHRLLIHFGVYEIEERNIEVSVMFDRAHFAISSLKDNFKKHIAYYDKELRNKLLWEQKITGELTDAINTMQIMPYLQPITDRNGKVVGAEALARWIHPENGFMSPGMFIPVFEKNGMIVEVDRHIWRCACEILSEWKGKFDDLFISINISPKDFYFIDIVSEITDLVAKYRIDPKKLRIEITETVMMTDEKEKFNILQKLRSFGFIVEMDDFGSGFSSLNLLKDMPVDVLKIDMKFLSSSDDNDKAQTIIKNSIKLSEELNIVSLTEGVETKKQYFDLSSMGCNLFQGYFFAKPMPRDNFEEFVTSQIN